MVSQRRYPEELVDKKMSKLKLNFSRKIRANEKKKEKGVPLIDTYHLRLNCLGKLSGRA